MITLAHQRDTILAHQIDTMTEDLKLLDGLGITHYLLNGRMLMFTLNRNIVHALFRLSKNHDYTYR